MRTNRHAIQSFHTFPIYRWEDLISLIKFDVMGKFLGFLYTHPRFPALHFFAYLMAVFLTIMSLVFVNSMSVFVLKHSLLLEDNEIKGNLTWVAICDELMSLPAAALWGFVSDYTSRRFVYVCGFFIIAASMCGYSYPGSLGSLIAVRLLFAFGSSACAPMITAVLGDCSGKKRGRIAAMVGVMASCGALFALFVLIKIPAWLTIGSYLDRMRGTFLGTAALPIAFALFFWFTAPKQPCKKSTTLSMVFFRKFALDSWKTAVPLFKDKRVWVALISSFAARASTSVLTLFLPEVIYRNHKAEYIICKLNPLATGCGNAAKDVSRYLGALRAAGLLSSPLWAIFIDRIGCAKKTGKYWQLPILAASLMCVLALLSLILFGNVFDRMAILYPSLILLGIGESGVIISGSAMISSEYVDAKLRGTFSGLYSFFGTCGILVCSIITYLTDHPKSCFIAVAFADGLLALMSIFAFFIPQYSTSIDSSVPEHQEEKPALSSIVCERGEHCTGSVLN